MTWFDKLKEFIAINLKNIKVLSPDINIHITKDKEDKVSVSDDEKKIFINFDLLSDNENKLINEVLKEGYEKKEIDLLEEKSEKRVRDIKEKSKSKQIRIILEFYKDKISSEHLKALEASLYLRAVFEQGEPIRELKKDIVHIFGNDGRNISNLCTAGYFEGYIKQVYEEMAFSPNFTTEKFQEYFEIIVRTSPFAIFVSKGMSEEELSGEILHKQETYQKYGIKFLAIHGIGKSNVQKIKKIVQEIEVQRNLNITINQEGNIILVKILF